MADRVCWVCGCRDTFTTGVGAEGKPPDEVVRCSACLNELNRVPGGSPSADPATWTNARMADAARYYAAEIAHRVGTGVAGDCGFASFLCEAAVRLGRGSG